MENESSNQYNLFFKVENISFATDLHSCEKIEF